ncbi:hypothetical protein BACINT_00987 [Bacteroides intestinalis DSM 17393]|jgi:hypothetical protein|uniref:Uncharacterized protein n=2 Tax=Bacteroides intestinalis TaxID=329854 RepID=A0A3E4IBC5_9BACE|nr:hypothetical protein BACINT_00987 [Bacteroides intestinalis DSM 17393]RGJ52492.1 hypothetical protein DXD57_16375 [Bacteroides intestinalis]RGK27762.1 hypothetical protein DXD27_02190 [Bacteroides intestinalis]RHI39258.1 hypothetical protein DW169_01410 [Bacteroides intestinalis]RHL94092.1 hypothetical protein DWZ95_07845 [Bacteroides intestinalis]
MLYLILFILLPITKLCPPIANRIVSNWGLFILQLRATQPPTEKRSFAGGITAFSLKQKRKKKGANGD